MSSRIDETDAATYVDVAMRGRLDDLRLLQRLSDGEGSNVLREGLGDQAEGLGVELEGGDPLEDQAQERLYEYPLCLETTTLHEIVLGTGGPDDRLIVEVTDDGRTGEIRRILYRYSWSGSGERVLSGEDYEVAEAFARQVVPELA